MRYLIPLCLAVVGGMLAPPAWNLLSAVPFREPGTDSDNGLSDAPDRVQARGHVEPRTGLRYLSFPTGGVLDQCQCAVGARMAPGTALMTLRGDERQAAVDVARARLELAEAEAARLLSGVHPQRIRSAQHQIALAECRVEHWTREHARMDALSGSAAVSGQRLSTAAYERDVARAELLRSQAEFEHLRSYVTTEDIRAARRQVELARSELALAEVRLEQTILRAPFEGQVLDVLRREGEAVDDISRPPVVLFGDTRRMRIRAEVDERFIRRVRVGMEVMVSGHNLQGTHFHGRVTRVTPCMGSQQLSNGAASERRSLEVAEVLVEMDDDFSAPAGLLVDVEIALGDCFTPES